MSTAPTARTNKVLEKDLDARRRAALNEESLHLRVGDWQGLQGDRLPVLPQADGSGGVKLYIAGPMTGLPDFNYPAFFAAAKDLRAVGYGPINPARVRPGKTPTRWLEFMRHSLRDIAECDGIATLPGWAASRGASLEVDIARRLDLPVRSIEDWCRAMPATGARA